MKQEKISDSINHISTQYIEEAAAYTAEAKPGAGLYRTRWIAAAACFCLVVLLGVGVWQSGLLRGAPTTLLEAPAESDKQDKTSSTNEIVKDTSSASEMFQNFVESENAKPSDDADTEATGSESIKGGQTTQTGGNGDIETDSMAFTRWKGLTCTLALYNTLIDEAKQDTLLTVQVGNYSDEELNSFVYQGETYPSLLAKQDEIREQNGKLGTLLKEGDELCYGEALYTTGGPKGYKWARQFYEERVAYYGKDFLAKYLGDRVFYIDLLKADIAKGKADYDAACKKIDAFLEVFYSAYAKETQKFFSDMDIPAEIVEHQCWISITPRQLAAIAEKEGMDTHFFSQVTDAEADDLKNFKTEIQ